MYSDKRKCLILVCLLSLGLSTMMGCRSFRALPVTHNREVELENPLTVAMADRWFVMDQVSDELDDYFRIYREERIRQVNDVLTEGWIETHPKTGATLLEPWHEDSTRGFERLHSTLQTVRRFAKVRVIPAGNCYQIDVRVYKELEDLQDPQLSTVTGTVIRHDSSLDIDLPETMLGPKYETVSKGWIPMGRDFTLEQRILKNIQARLTNVDGSHY